MRNVPVQVLSASDASSATGSAFYVGQYVAASFVISLGDATANGTVSIQGSNDLPVGDPGAFVPTNFNNITGATAAVAAGVASAIVLQTMNFQYIRAVYTRSSGGSTTIVVNMSGLAV